MDTRISPVRERVERVREALAHHGAHAVLVPSADPHLSEYLPGRWQGREWLSGFTGSMGTLVITRTQAALFADSRYWVQAERELEGSGIALVKIPTGAATHHIDWLARETPRGAQVVADGQVLGLAAAQALRAALDGAGVVLRTNLDVLADVWPDRPGLPAATVYAHAAPEAVEPRSARLARVREAVARHGASHHFVSTVDDIAWITNLRGGDVDYNPVFLAHLLIDATRATLYVGAGKVPAALAAQLQADGITLADYGAAAAALAALPAGSTLLVDPRRITLGFREQVAAGVRVIEAINPSTLFKSRKGAAEAGFIRAAMEEDGAAMCHFYAWFEAALERGERISELIIDEHLSAERARRPGFKGLSFSTIAGFNANGALPHYRATPESYAWLEGSGLLLIDSGGQYLGGTTDITRVWPIGEPSAAQKRDFTLVLKAMMALSRVRFPRGTLSPMLDAIARAPLWAEGLDYGHGTGHGVGYFLNVHEGPQSISKAVPEATMAMEPGMITSNEPGLYRPGQWGVRIENLVLNAPVDTPENGAFGEMLEFETLTLCPIDARCIELSLLRADEIAWLNGYHAMVRERLAPKVSGEALAWLERRTAPV
ncbi:aminopeptidase P family protein [Aquincola sp. S2]|uniref:Aminopeptidase P family protein n=1 Tax=Pseudaquabacterium terrae TaxID=2732868 RepID=A0ABX2EH09_9BURK|nr:aminopeptidase family protein P [Aquabacterium terrae]NRF67861.1 aminopeptidase P family protein [Aquabacterium terrae]